MQRCTRPSAISQMPAPPAAERLGGYFTGGDPVSGTAATVPGYEWFNRVQEELVGIVEAAGLALDGGDNAQVLNALQRLFGSRVTTVSTSRALTISETGLVLVDAAAGDVVVSLPDLGALAGPAYRVMRVDTAASLVTIQSAAPVVAEDGNTLYLVGAGASRSVVAVGGSRWASTDRHLVVPTGTVRLGLTGGAVPGWLVIADGSIGPAGSGATSRASADAWPLYATVWSSINQAWAPTQDAAGAQVGRGASAAADWGAGRRLLLPRLLGRALAGAGAGSGLSVRAVGQWLGEEAHTQTLSELAAHGHGSVWAPQGGPYAHNSGSGTAYWCDTMLPQAGGGAPANVMQPTTFLATLVKL